LELRVLQRCVPIELVEQNGLHDPPFLDRTQGGAGPGQSENLPSRAAACRAVLVGPDQDRNPARVAAQRERAAIGTSDLNGYFPIRNAWLRRALGCAS